MNCRETQHTMDQRIAQMVISEEADRTLQEHLTACPDCSDRYEELCAVDGFIAAHAEMRDPSVFLWTRIEARVEERPRPAESYWIGSVLRFPLLALAWAKQRQLAAGLCMVALLVSVLFVNRQSVNFERNQLLGQIDRYADQLAVTAGNENPFPVDLAGAAGSDNPFPVLPEINMDKNPFGDVKS